VDLPTRSFDLARPGVAPPLVTSLYDNVSIVRQRTYMHSMAPFTSVVRETSIIAIERYMWLGDCILLTPVVYNGQRQ